MSQAEFSVNEPFSYNGSSIKRPGLILVVSESTLQVEVAKGVHGESGKPISSLLNHCSPVNDVAKEAVKGMKVKPYVLTEDGNEEEEKRLNEEAKKAEIDRLRKEFDKIGKGYDPHWSGRRLEKELVKAQKEALPAPTAPAPKKEKV